MFSLANLGEESPNRAIADADMTRRKLAPYVIKRQIGRLGRPGEQPVSLIFETRVALPAHRLGRDARILNHDKALLGIPTDSVTVDNALAINPPSFTEVR
jgi:hypothetical protein